MNMRKQKQTLTISKIAMTIFALGAIGGTANAQWAVTNVNDPIFFGPTGIFTQMMGQINNSSKAATDQLAALTEVGRKQQIQLQEDTDQRMRQAMGQSKVAEKISEIRPTLEQCRVITENASKAAAMKVANAGSGAAGNQPRYDSTTRRTSQNPAQNPNSLMRGARTEIERVAYVVETRKALGTCTKEEIDQKIPGCFSATATSSKGGDYAGTTMLPPSDATPLSLFGNTKVTDKLNSEFEFANRSINEKDTKGIDVARAYINNVMYGNMPLALTPELLQRYPTMEATSRIIRGRLDGSAKALRDILSLTIAPESAHSPSSAAGKYWSNSKGEYQQLLNMKAPESPSMRDYLLFKVTKDLVGIPQQTAMSGDQMLTEMLQKQALNNYIAFKQLEATENLNVQMASLVANQITPIDMKDYNENLLRDRARVSSTAAPASANR